MVSHRDENEELEL